MKKIRIVGLMMLMSVSMAGNIFADGPVSGAGAVPGFLSFAVGQVFALFANDECPLRQCQDCRPNNGQGDCRPE